MAGVLKKGYLEVKTKGRLGSGYKRKYVILQRNTYKGIKQVIIKEAENVVDSMEFLPLSGRWTVQDKTSRSSRRYPFELVIGSDVVMTFSCFSVSEREDWSESFRTLNKLSTHPPLPPSADMHPVILERSLSSTEVGVWGPCLLCVRDAAIVLYSEDGRNRLHHWSAKTVKQMTPEGDQLILLAYRAENDTAVSEFHFNTDPDTASRVLTAWNLAVIQYLARNNPEKLNEISSFIQSQGSKLGHRAGSNDKLSRGSGSTRGLFGANRLRAKSPDHKVMRSNSLTERSTYSTGHRSVSPDMFNQTSINRLSTASQASQDSYTINSIRQGSDEDEEQAPPVPPRYPRRQWISSKDEPDYSYIKDDEVGGSETGSSQGGYGIVERQLDDLLQDILEDSRQKTLDRTKRKILPAPVGGDLSIPRSKTIGHAGGVNYLLKAKEFADQHNGHKEPDDYLEPVPSKNPLPTSQLKVHHSHSRSLPSSHYGLESHLIKHHSPNTHLSQDPDDQVQLRSKPPADVSATASLASTTKTTSSPPLPPRILPTHTTMMNKGSSSSPVFSSTHKDDISPYAQTSNLWIGLAGKPKSGANSPSSVAPPIPPRSPIKQPRDRYHSASSASSSNSSINQRCRRCNGMKRTVGKTVSLDPHHAGKRQVDGDTTSGDIPCGSLPDLHRTSPIPENSLGRLGRQADSGSSSPHSCSNDTDVHTSSHSISSLRSDSKHSPRRLSSGEPQRRLSSGEPQHRPSFTRNGASPPTYLQVVENPPPSAGEDKALDTTLEMLNSVVRDLEELQAPNAKQRTRPTDLDAALKQVQQVQSDLALAKQEPRKPTSLYRSSSVNKTPPPPVSSSSSIARLQQRYSATNLGTGSTRPTRSSSETHHRSNSQGQQQFFNTTGGGGGGGNTSPQVPPRSAVSLKLQSPQSNHHYHHHHHPHRQSSSPVIGLNRHTDNVYPSSVHRTSLPRYNTHIGGVESRGGSTVFIHHLKDIKRTQC